MNFSKERKYEIGHDDWKLTQEEIRLIDVLLVASLTRDTWADENFQEFFREAIDSIETLDISTKNGWDCKCICYYFLTGYQKILTDKQQRLVDWFLKIHYKNQANMKILFRG
jgi:hypothetical protein